MTRLDGNEFWIDRACRHDEDKEAADLFRCVFGRTLPYGYRKWKLRRSSASRNCLARGRAKS